ncbi:U3 small nucleolar RNA-associated protein 10 [Sesbania bispinosa]|nr:U3 small nucleolar RNA-associated protein 10 [Sesbania bispinosa]
MATSLASQLEAIRSFAQADSAPLKRPFTRPSILFDPKEAADIDIETIFTLAHQGLEVLISTDERFRNYKNDLFSHRSKELDRELMGIEQNNNLNVLIASYLRLLSGHFLLPSALKTLEYLIRRHKIHVYNIEDLILCALPYHDTHAFVRIVQILDIRNSKWGFLDGVKVSGAPPPRMVIVQQCLRDKGILEVLCNYASPSKKFQPSRHVIGFCTAVFVEVLGTVVTVNDDLVKRILPFVVSGLQPSIKGFSDHKAGSLMIIGLLGNKAALAPKLLNSLIRSVAEVAREEAKELMDLHWFRLSLIALINLVQSQNVEILPTRALEILKEIRDLAGILLEMSKEFNIERFLCVLMDSLIDCSSSDEYCQQALQSLIEKVPIDNSVHHVVTKILSTCVKLSQKVGDSSSLTSAGWAKKILIIVNSKYPAELRGAVHHFLQILCKMLDGNLDSSFDISDSKVWFALYHPKADVRRATLLDINSSGILKNKAVVSESLIDIQEAILRQLDDKDLTVVQAALYVDGLPNIIGPSKLLQALQNVLRRCIGKLLSGSTDNVSLTGEVAVTCLKNAISYFHDHAEYLKNIAAMIFPLLLVIPQTQGLNLKALVLVNKINWPLYGNVAVSTSGEVTSVSGSFSSINLKTINNMAENFMVHPEEHIAWFVESCNDSELSKTLFFLVLLQSLLIKPKGDDFSALFENVFPILKAEWESLVTSGDVLLDEFNSEVLDWDCSAFFNHLLYANLKPLNAKVMVCIFWRLLAALISAVPSDILLDDDAKWVSKIKDLFVFFASSQFKHVFREHLHFLAAQCRISPPRLLSKFFTEEGIPAAVQVESLQCYAFLCSLSQDRWQIELLAEFPSVLVPLAGDNQAIRVAAMNCIDELRALWCRIEHSGKKNGNNVTWFHFLGELLWLLDQQKTLILSDKKFLPSLFESTLSSSCHNIVVPQNIENRFDQSTKKRILDFILGSALKFSNYGKLMILSLLKGIGNAIMQAKVEPLLSHFMKQYYDERDKSCQKFSNIETQIVCLLLESCIMSSPSGGDDLQYLLLKALQLDAMTSDVPAYIEPCITVLNKLNSQFYMGLKNEMKEHVFCELVFLCRNANGDVQSATKEALMRIDISFSTVGHVLDLILAQKSCINSSADEKTKKKQKLTHQESEPHTNNICRRVNPVYILSSLLDVLLLKKDITNRHLLLDPLFKLLSKVFSEEWVNGTLSLERRSSQPSPSPSEANSTVLYHIQQNLLIILEDIIMSVKSMDPLNEKMTNAIDINLLIDCARTTNIVVSRNHVFSLLSAVTRVFPEKVFGHILDILPVIGESAVTQIDSHSMHVFEDLISAIVPCWLSKTDDVEKLMKIFIDILPEIVEHRRLSIVLYLLRTLGEGKSLATLLILLFCSLVSRKATSFLSIENPDALTFYATEWEYKFAVQICEQYTSMTWLPSIVMLLEQRGNKNIDQALFLELFLALQFSLQKLQDPEFLFKLESGEDTVVIQRALGELMEQVVFLLHLVDAKKKQLSFPVIMRKELKETMRAAVRNVTTVMIPSVYFKSIIKLLRHSDKNVGKKALGLLCETARNHKKVSLTLNDSKGSSSSFSWLHMNESSQESLNEMCLEILRVLDDSSNTSLKVAAVSALEVLAERFPSNNDIFSVCLGSVTRCITSHNLAVTSSCLRTTAALINVLGPKALAELPQIMNNVMKSSRIVLSNLNMKPKNNDVLSEASNESHFVFVLLTLEAVVNNLGGFLNPYLTNILELLMLHPEYVSETHVKVQSRAHGVRKLLAEKIPVRLALPPLLKLYPVAIEAGDKSLTIMFDMLATMIGTMDRSSIVAFHGKIFDLCLVALDLRRQSPLSVLNIDVVEKGVMNAMITLTLKLTESMFKPLFIKSIEWVESEVDETSSAGSIDRAISFYGMVNKLADSHRLLFVPYFKHLLDSCVRHLSDGGDVKVGNLSQKKKKAKILDDGNIKETGSLSIKGWHLRTLVLSSLHKCFLFDTGTLKFLDSSNFQASHFFTSHDYLFSQSGLLLRPIISQLVIDPPALLDDSMNIPSVKEVDDLLVMCIGQMAVTAGSDLLWKPLNHEVSSETTVSEIIYTSFSALSIKLDK